MMAGTIDPRMAIEALRAGVPNRAAIRLMGTEQTNIEDAFEAALASARTGGGIGIAGGFGTGKSHMLGYLAEVARQQGFVVSRVVISKETPLSHPAHVLAAALREAALPDRPDDPIGACVAVLREKPEALGRLERTVAEQGDRLAPVFSACLFLLRQPSTLPETLRRITRLWSGAKIGMPVIRQALAAVGAGRTYSLKAISTATMTEQLSRFIPLMFQAVGYAGWCVLLDEVELIGRYTPLQRALSYVALGRWLGLDASHRLPGIVSAYAVTDDFVTAVINAREDSERLPERLVLKGLPAEATLAQSAIRHIERTVQLHRLVPPTSGDLAACQDKVQQLYSTAYDWPAPALPPTERTSSGTLRQYIKGWITHWDLQRLGNGDAVLVTSTMVSNYAEDAALAEPSAPDDEEG